ncbi:tripartite tricarboxylate transporter permease [Ensifer adhaerens]|uniref:tripartite tricarboxylate transporter permease n=1 Tax=Ensifer adhaerens TaxID=106592 RepID=UPI001CC9F2B0|nr:tripartite tricarboxylate transporter permease [Ensifer adhaerens]MBZ7925751.1 tripartite tricarboxylate transporter permease [Ensifer adhaerens]
MSCPNGSVPRERALALVLEEALPNWRDLKIHECSPIDRGISVKLKREAKDLIQTQFYPDLPRGSTTRKFRNEDLQKLTFPANTFDLFISLDVMEHIPDPKAAIYEIWRHLNKPWLRGTFIGFPIGAMPAGGAEIGTFLSYAAEKRLTKHPEEFGNGAIEGVAGPEAANNASAAGTLVPLLTLGLPTTATAAIMLAGFQQYGLQPGPLLFATNPQLVWGLIASLLIANFMLLVLNLPLIGLWVKLLTIPKPWLYAGILLFATLGTIGANPSVYELGMLLAFGLLGFAMRIFGYPIAPVVVGLILGPLAEQQLRRALAISQGDFSVLFTSPIAAVLLAIAAAALIVPLILRARGRGEVLSQLAANED